MCVGWVVKKEERERERERETGARGKRERGAKEEPCKRPSGKGMGEGRGGSATPPLPSSHLLHLPILSSSSPLRSTLPHTRTVLALCRHPSTIRLPRATVQYADESRYRGGRRAGVGGGGWVRKGDRFRSEWPYQEEKKKWGIRESECQLVLNSSLYFISVFCGPTKSFTLFNKCKERGGGWKE